MDIEARFKGVSQSGTFMRIVRNFKLDQKKVLDVGSGYGEYLSFFGSGSIGITTTVEEVLEGKKRGLDIRFGNAEMVDKLSLPEDFEVVWANNIFEHMLSPHSFLARLKKITKKDTILILGVPVVPKIELLLKIKKFRGALAISHINFFNERTLRLTVERAGWNVLEMRSFHFESSFLDWASKFLAPHIYVVATKDMSFSYSPKKIKEWKSDKFYNSLIKK